MSGEPLVSAAAVLAALLYFTIAGLHAYWALDGVWPGKDRESLYRTVVGGPPGMRGPGRAATLMVAGILVVASATVLAGAGLMPAPVPRGWLRIAAVSGASVLLLRGLEGFVDTRLRPQTVGSPFARLNARVYSPLCLLLALCTALAVLK